MPIIPYITDAAIDAQRVPADLVAAIRARRADGQLLNLDRMLLHSAPIARGWNVFMGAIRRDLMISPLLRELAICAVAKLNRAEYEWIQHVPEFLAAGGTKAQLDALQDIDHAPLNNYAFDERERLVLQLTAEMTRDIEVNPATIGRLQSLLSDREATEIVGVIAAYNMVSRYLIALGIEPE